MMRADRFRPSLPYPVPGMILTSALVMCLFSSRAMGQESFTLPLWRSGPPTRIVHASAEHTENRAIDRNEAGLNRSISNVSDPTVTVYLPPRQRRSGIGVVIFPGGGHRRIVIDKEGFDIARWFVKEGIAGIVVQYRTTPDSSRIWGANRDTDLWRTIVSDAVEAVTMTMDSAGAWGLRRDGIGVMGFSAGGYLAATVSAADSLGLPPAFQVLVYPALRGEQGLLDPKRRIPTWIGIAADDATSQPAECIDLHRTLLQHGVSAELHVFSAGGHGFGLGVRGGPVTAWKELALRWMKTVAETP